MLIVTITVAIIGAIFGTQGGGGATQTPGQTIEQAFDVMNAAIDQNVEDQERKNEAKRLVSEIQEEIQIYNRSTLRLERQAFWRIDSEYGSTTGDYAPVLQRFDDGWVGLLYLIADKRDTLAELLTDDEWKAVNEAAAKWYEAWREKLMKSLKIDDLEDERAKSIAAAAGRVSP
jgi:hypothetical protein